ncbi:helix-turn-helix domain-containing protein [Chryseobacterium sp. MIQD13]|uniref:helix-turn-helix domain-containing protein n=1 Tax=Chryseobacterium sp. MIQD13 TaxID=3422310 RepID=UPI003D2CA508
MRKICLLFIILFNIPLFSQYSNEELNKIFGHINAVGQKDPDSAIIIAKSYIPKLHEKSHIAELHGLISQSYSAMGKREQALQYALKANQIAVTTENYKGISQSYGTVAVQYRNLKLYEKAKKALRNGILNLEKINTGEKLWLKTGFLLEYATDLYEEGKYDSAIIYNNKALNVLSQAKSNQTMIQSYYAYANASMAMNYFKKNKMDSAEYYYNKSLKLSNGTFDGPYRKINTYINLSLIYNYRKEYQRAIDTLKTIEGKISEDHYPIKAGLYSYLAQNYKSVNDLANYQKYNELFLKVNEKLNTEEQKAIADVVKTMDDDLKKETKKKELNRNIIIFSLLSAALIILFLILYHRKKRKKESDIYKEIISKMKKKAEENRDLMETAADNASAKTISNPKKTIPADLEKKLLSKLDKFEKNTKFINPKLTLASMAADFETNTHYVSEIINMHKQKNFNTYINELRIDYICSRIIRDSKYRNYKISYLAEESGFSSHSIFTKTFKSITGISPSTFIEQAKKNNPDISN